MLYEFQKRAVRLHPLDGFKVRVSENCRRMVAFFGQPSPKDGKVKFGGTAFFVIYKEDDFGFGYLVTAAHVARHVDPDRDIALRVNRVGGGSDVFTFEDAVWQFHPDPTVDVAVISANVSPNDWDVAYYNLHDFTPIGKTGCGDPISIVGCYRIHAGTSKNLPIVHSGNIALRPDPHEKIPITDRVSGKTSSCEGYLIEAHTLEGLSGSPVFHRQMVSLNEYDHEGHRPLVIGALQLLGLYSGAWDGEPSKLLAEDRKWEGDRRVAIGMGIVVPAEKIMELIVDHPDLKVQRAKFIDERRKASAATTDSAFLSDAPRPNGDNPTHREDFTRLVGAAARKPARED